MVKIPDVSKIEISKIKLHPKNVKKHPEEQIKNLMQLIEWVGFKDPIVLDKDDMCRAGHGRLIAAERLGMTEVPFVRLEGLTKKQMDLFIYMDNQINESPWIKENVQLLLQDIPMKDLELFDINWDGIRKVEYDEETEPVPEPPEVPKAQLGQIYQLGNHRLMCGDCRDKATIDKLMAGRTVDCLQSDPPYGIDYAGKNEFLNEIDKGNRIQTGLKNDDTIMDYRKFIREYLENIPFSDYNSIYIWMSEIRTFEIRQAFEDLGIKYSQTIVWVKNNHVLSRLDYHPKHEPCLYGWKGKHKFYGNSSQMSVQIYDKPLVNDLHPTMKPIELIRNLIVNSTQKDMLVFDGFMGSGTTLIASEQTNRTCYGIELDPRYVDVIIERWENFTGKKASLI